MGCRKVSHVGTFEMGQKGECVEMVPSEQGPVMPVAGGDREPFCSISFQLLSGSPVGFSCLVWWRTPPLLAIYV